MVLSGQAGVATNRAGLTDPCGASDFAPSGQAGVAKTSNPAGLTNLVGASNFTVVGTAGRRESADLDGRPGPVGETNAAPTGGLAGPNGSANPDGPTGESQRHPRSCGGRFVGDIRHRGGDQGTDDRAYTCTVHFWRPGHQPCGHFAVPSPSPGPGRGSRETPGGCMCRCRNNNLAGLL